MDDGKNLTPSSIGRASIKAAQANLDFLAGFCDPDVSQPSDATDRVESSKAQSAGRSRGLGKLGEHMAELRNIYEGEVIALARRAFGASSELPGVKVEIVKLNDGFALQFKFKD